MGIKKDFPHQPESHIYIKFLSHVKALNKSNPAFVEHSTKVILLSQRTKRKSPCFRRAFNESQPAFGELLHRSFGEPAFSEFLESFRRFFGELLEKFWRAFREPSQSFWRAYFQKMFRGLSEVLLSESFHRVFRELSEPAFGEFSKSFQRAFKEPDFREFIENFRRACYGEFSESFRRACFCIKEQIGLLH